MVEALGHASKFPIMFPNKKQMVENAKSCQPKAWKNM